MQVADVFMLTGAVIMALTLLLIVVDVFTDRQLVTAARQRVATLVVFGLFLTSLILKHVV